MPARGSDSDRDFVLAAVAQDKCSYSSMPARGSDLDRDFMLAAVAKDGRALRYCRLRHSELTEK